MLCAQAWKPSSQHAGEKRGVAGLLLGWNLEPTSPQACLEAVSFPLRAPHTQVGFENALEDHQGLDAVIN